MLCLVKCDEGRFSSTVLPVGSSSESLLLLAEAVYFYLSVKFVLADAVF